MEFKREDLIMVRTFEDKFIVGFKPSFMDEVLPIPEVEEEVIEEEKEPELSEEELAAIEKEKKKAELLAKLKELED